MSSKSDTAKSVGQWRTSEQSALSEAFFTRLFVAPLSLDNSVHCLVVQTLLEDTRTKHGEWAFSPSVPVCSDRPVEIAPTESDRDLEKERKNVALCSELTGKCL